MSTSNRLSTPDSVPVGPVLSMFDPVYLGIDEAGEPVYLDDTGGAVHDPAEAKLFLSEVDARAGLAIAELAPIGSARNWRIEPLRLI